MKISKGNSKIGKIPNISMTPIKSCGNCKACAKDCYALKAYKQYPNVRKAWDENFEDAKKRRFSYFIELSQYLRKHQPKFFRWHVSGDILDQEYLNAMISTARNYPETKFLAFTKMHEFDYSNKPENLSIVFSMFPSMPLPAAKMPMAWVQDGTETRIPNDALACPGHCDNCGLCWNLPVLNKDVYFEKH
jgi:ferredoxin